ncbi:MAG TPA: acyl-CoA dehydrogenase family protein [Acidimicrobiales bacterium]|nr:acyl-CoA dehydrogenase family protein [Acidimicrobiales bacterium]
MRLSDSRAEARFRADLAAWLDDNQPAADRASEPPRSPGHIPGWARDWQATLFDAGWLVPRWPPELGGRDASAVEQMIYLEELARRRIPRTTNLQGLDVCAPTLADHGVGAQQDDWLPSTLRGDISWCVAVDEVEVVEPGDGSSTPTSGRQPAIVEGEGGGLALHGSIAAPPGAADADRCLCGVTAEVGGRRIDGVAVVAVDLGAEGVTRPSDTADRLVFDGVGIEPEQLIGERDQGWPVLHSVRARLRSVRWITSLLAIERALGSLAETGRARGLADDGVFRDTLAGLRVDADAVRALAYRALAKQSTGRPNPELGMLPLVTAQTEERVYLTGLEVLGADGLDMGLDGPQGWPSGSWASEWADATAEVAGAGGLGAERDRVAGRVLGLPLR